MLRAFQWDLARQVERLDVLLDLLPRYASWGYQELYLHLEDSVHYPSLPGVGRADAYQHADILSLVNAAKSVGIGVVPIVNLLGHTQYLIKSEEWRDLNELRAEDGSPLERGQVCPLHPRFPELVERILADTVPFCTARKLHVGLDESFHLGKCPRCREEVARLGLAGHFANHVGRLHASVSKTNLRLGLWGDMLALFPEVIPAFPPKVTVYDWYYYPFPKQPRLELHGFRDYDLVPALRDADAGWWACPMNGAFRWEPLPIFRDRIENARSWWKRANTQGAVGFLVTSWEAYRVAFPLYAVVDAAIASLWLDGPDLAAEEMLARGFERVGRGSATTPATGASTPAEREQRLARAALAADVYPFSGYYEWEANLRWDGGVTLASPAELQAAVESLARLADEARKAAKPGASETFADSLALRLYFARRAAFIRDAADVVSRLRQALFSDHAGLRQARLIQRAVASAAAFARELESGIRAAEAMWVSTRDPEVEGQNQILLRSDALRLQEWISWLGDVLRKPAQARRASCVFGEKRITFIVNVDQPCVQRVSVEARQGDGPWREVAGRHIIEFQAWAATPAAVLDRPFSVGIRFSDTDIRIRLQGPGEVDILNLEVSDGITEQTLADRFPLGSPPPSHGLPELQAISGTAAFALK